MNHDKNCICMNMEERIKKDFFLLFIPYMAFHFFFPLLLSQGRVLQEKNKRLIRS